MAKIAIVTDRPDVAPVFDIVIPMRKFDQAGARFKKGNVIVAPAICHFCGDWTGVPQYKIAEYYLRKGKRLSLSHRYAWTVNRLMYNLKAKHFPRFMRKIKTIIRRA